MSLSAKNKALTFSFPPYVILYNMICFPRFFPPPPPVPSSESTSAFSIKMRKTTGGGRWTVTWMRPKYPLVIWSYERLSRRIDERRLHEGSSQVYQSTIEICRSITIPKMIVHTCENEPKSDMNNIDMRNKTRMYLAEAVNTLIRDIGLEYHINSPNLLPYNSVLTAFRVPCVISKWKKKKKPEHQTRPTLHHPSPPTPWGTSRQPSTSTDFDTSGGGEAGRLIS